MHCINKTDMLIPWRFHIQYSSAKLKHKKDGEYFSDRTLLVNISQKEITHNLIGAEIPVPRD